MLVHTLKKCTFLCTYHDYFLIVRGIELGRFFPIRNAFEVFGFCDKLLQHFSLLYIQTSHNDSSHIEDVHPLFCAHLIIFYHVSGVLNLDIITSTQP